MRGAKALVLQGHDGAGLLAVQELALLRVEVTVQIPPGAWDDKGKGPSSRSSSEADEDNNAFDTAEERVRAAGASELLIDEPLAALAALPEDAFDLVIDCIGGRKIWDAARRVLKTQGQFTTLVGESAQAIPTVNQSFRSNLRSLHRAFVKADRKALGYAWISPVADVDWDGEDIRDSLGAIARLAADGVMMPWVDGSRCVPFERAPTLFTNGGKRPLRDGRTAVVRIVD